MATPRSGSSGSTCNARPQVPSEWTAFRSFDIPRPQAIWTDYDASSELILLPNDRRVSPRLEDIIRWSMQRPSPQGDSPRTNTTDKSKDRRLNVEAGQRLRTEDRTDASSVLFDAHSKKSSNLDRAVPKLRGLRHDLILTAVTRISALKDKHDRDRAKSPESLKKELHATPATLQTGECTSCFEDLLLRDLVKLPCTHNYCKPCLATLVMTALQSEATFPPKCCLSAIPPATIIVPLDKKQQDLYKDKVAEYSVAAINRRYCPNAKCLKWIPPGRLHSSRLGPQKCPHCQTKICGMCRGVSHARSVDCPQDFGLEATISVAEAEGWRRCHNCRTMVERATGCRHITCKCGAEFCYICGSRWRTCSCTEVDEVNRQAELRRQRAAREAVDQAEADEIAQAIAIVEALVRQEAEQRRQREEEEERERQREEVELARLEQERLEEEALRLQEADEAERQLREILRLSIQEDAESLRHCLKELVHLQHIAIDDRHGAEEQRAVADFEKTNAILTKNAEMLQQNMQKNVNRRIEQLKWQHQQEFDELAQRHEQQEDDIFLQIQTHLKGKPNREVREQRLLDSMKNDQTSESDNLYKTHKDQIKSLEGVASMEVEGLRRSGDLRKAKAKRDFDNTIGKLLTKASVERQWFYVIWERRIELVEEHERMMIFAFESGREPQGLTEKQAMSIMPLPIKTGRLIDTSAPRSEQQSPLDSIQVTPVELEAPMSLAIPRKPVPVNPVSGKTTPVNTTSEVTIKGANTDLRIRIDSQSPTKRTQDNTGSSESSYMTAKTHASTEYADIDKNPWAWAMNTTDNSRPVSGISSLGGIQLARHLTPPSPNPSGEQAEQQPSISTAMPIPHNGNAYLSTKNGECSRPIYDLPPMAFENPRAPPTPPESPHTPSSTQSLKLLSYPHAPYGHQTYRSDGLKLRVPSRLSSGANSIETLVTSAEQPFGLSSLLYDSRKSPHLGPEPSMVPQKVPTRLSDISLDMSNVKNKSPVEDLGTRKPNAGSFDASVPSVKGSSNEISRKIRWPFRRKQYTDEEVRQRVKEAMGDAFA